MSRKKPNEPRWC